MALVYALVRTIAVFLRKRAEYAHSRVKKAYEATQEKFSELEHRCKADEVSVGRPVSYPVQIELLKSYESNERARQRWLAADKKLKRRRWIEKRISDFSGRKIPYTFGVIDMALIIKVLDFVGGPGSLDLRSVTELISMFH